MKMTRAEKLAIMEAAHTAQRAYREVLDQAHADIGKAIQDMPAGTTFTASELASAAGVCYQTLYFLHTSDREALNEGRKTETKRYAAILPDGSVDMAQTIQITRTKTAYTRTDRPVSTLGNKNQWSLGTQRFPDGDSTEILEILKGMQK